MLLLLLLLLLMLLLLLLLLSLGCYQRSLKCSTMHKYVQSKIAPLQPSFAMLSFVYISRFT
jgi:hypothetical protein